MLPMWLKEAEERSENMLTICGKKRLTDTTDAASANFMSFDDDSNDKEVLTNCVA